MSNDIVVQKSFSYEGTEYEYEEDRDGVIWVNVTQMCKSFGKNLKDVLKLDSTKNYGMAILEKYARVTLNHSSKIIENRHYSDFGLIRVVMKSDINGSHKTFAIRKLALFIAEMCSPKFHLECNDALEKFTAEKLLSKHTALISDDEEERMRQLAEAATTAMNAIIAKKTAERLANDAMQKVSALETRVERAIEWHNEVLPAVNYARVALGVTDDQSMAECSWQANAQCLDRLGIKTSMSRNEVFALLRRLGVVQKDSSMFYQNFSEFFSTKMTEVNGKMRHTMLIRKEYLHRFIHMLIKEAAKPGSIKSFRKEMGKDGGPLTMIVPPEQLSLSA